MNRRVDYVLQTLKSYHIKDFTIHKSLQRVEKLYQMEVEVVVEFSDFSKCEQVCNLLVEKLDETVKVSRPFLYHTPSKLDSLRYGMDSIYTGVNIHFFLELPAGQVSLVAYRTCLVICHGLPGRKCRII